MKIILVVVDKLPESASSCYASNIIRRGWDKVTVDCDFTLKTMNMNGNDCITQRCPNCPLVEEAEEVQE